MKPCLIGDVSRAAVRGRGRGTTKRLKEDGGLRLTPHELLSGHYFISREVDRTRLTVPLNPRLLAPDIYHMAVPVNEVGMGVWLGRDKSGSLSLNDRREEMLSPADGEEPSDVWITQPDLRM
ncbi:hypothetical protein IMZ48_16275 [Candidatus Bathyarchaeota archaeon]|nr:hypothetical protein [Candidatus Bathyarchaeota archaeon]